jgi:hypothetical protein
LPDSASQCCRFSARRIMTVRKIAGQGQPRTRYARDAVRLILGCSGSVPVFGRFRRDGGAQRAGLRRLRIGVGQQCIGTAVKGGGSKGATLRSAEEGLWMAVMDSITAWFVAIAHLFYSTPGRACAAEAEKKEIFYVQGHCRGMLCALQEALYVDRTIDPIESPKFRGQH